MAKNNCDQCATSLKIITGESRVCDGERVLDVMCISEE